METQRIPTSVYAEMTPNPAVMKFVADRTLVPHSHQLEFRTKAEAMTCSPLATELFNFPFVTGVFMSGSMVSVTKDESLGWEMIVQQLRTYITEWLMEHAEAVEEAKLENAVASLGQRPSEGTDAPSNDALQQEGVFIDLKDVNPLNTTTQSSNCWKNSFARLWSRTGAPSTSWRSRKAPCTCTFAGHVLDVRRRPKP